MKNYWLTLSYGNKYGTQITKVEISSVNSEKNMFAEDKKIIVIYGTKEVHV